jgi:hypothetical protein
VLRNAGDGLSYRDPRHSGIEAVVSSYLFVWLNSSPLNAKDEILSQL